MIGTAVFLFDHSGIAARPWADRGWDCHCLDILHDDYRQEGGVHFVPADLDPGAYGWGYAEAVLRHAPGRKVLFGWPPFDDMTGSGARHFAAKLAADPGCQARAARRAMLCAELAERHGAAWMVENPVGLLCTLWRSPDVIWNPFEFGGYLPENDAHPKWPQYIAARDAYPKKTGAWMGGGFVFPERAPVVPEIIERVTASGRTIRGSRQFMKLGGKSHKTKEIRNMTPRGAALAFCLANIGSPRQADLFGGVAA